MGRVPHAAGTRRAHGDLRAISSLLVVGDALWHRLLLAPRPRLASPMRAAHAATRTGSWRYNTGHAPVRLCLQAVWPPVRVPGAVRRRAAGLPRVQEPGGREAAVDVQGGPAR